MNQGPASSPITQKASVAIANGGLARKHRNAKSGSIGISATNTQNYFKDTVNSVSPLQLHHKLPSEVSPLVAYGDNEANGADQEI